MTPADHKAAMRLYRAYKTDSIAFRQIAEKYGMTTTDLTVRMHRAKQMEQ